MSSLLRFTLNRLKKPSQAIRFNTLYSCEALPHMSSRVDQHVFLIKSIDLFISLFQLKHYVGFFFSSFDLLMWFNVPLTEKNAELVLKQQSLTRVSVYC
jgi:hypothetical protein